TDTGGLVFGTATGTNAGFISGGGTSTINVSDASVNSIAVTLGTGSNTFTFTGTNGAAADPITVNTGMTSGSQIKTPGAVKHSGSIALPPTPTTEPGPGAASPPSPLPTSSATGTTLTGSNAVRTFNATNTTSGNVALTNTTALVTITGISET